MNEDENYRRKEEFMRSTVKTKADRSERNNSEGEKQISAAHEFLSVLIYMAVVFCVCFLIITYVGQRSRVSGSSMEPTLSDGDNLIVDKLSYHLHEPERFDIIIFPYLYQENTYYIKRIIGLPGETVYIDEDGTIYINGVVLDEDYGLETIENPGLASSPITLGADEYFVLGDNRNNSTDSRFASVSNIKRENIVGKAWMRIYPFDQITLIKHQ